MALSYENYTGNNSTTTFSIPFTYTATSEISVTVNGVAETGLTFPSSSQVQLTSAPASGTIVQVRRTTNLAARAIDFASGSVLTEEDLDNSNIQVFHASQESVDLTDDTIQEDIDSKWDAESKVIKNVANPTNAQDAATKDYLENTWLTTADKAQLNALNTTNLNTVANNTANVNAVAGDATDIGTVSTNIASVNTVATNIADVVTVANDLNEAISEIETAANDLNEAVSEIDTVSNAIANVNTVGLGIANVNTVAGAVANVNTTATNINNVNTVAGISGNVTTVAGISANVTAVAGDATDIGTVATNIADINTVAGNNADIDTVAGISANVTSVAGNATNINTVAGIAANVTTVATNNANVTSVAGNASNINSAVSNASNINSAVSNATNINSAVSNATNINTVAGNITNVNNVSGSIANVNTVATNVAGVNSFADRYRVASSAPSSSLDVGDLYFDTSANELKVYKSSGWAAAGSTVNGTSARFHYDIGSAVTSVTGNDAAGNALAYDAGFIDVYVNGVRMSTADVTITSGDTVTFASALADGDEVDIVAFGTFAVANIVSTGALDSGSITSNFGTINNGASAITTTGVGSFGSLDISGAIDVDGTTNLDVVDIDGAVDFASTTAHAGNATFADNVKAIFGTGSDLQIYHNAGTSFITESGSSNFKIGGENLYLQNTAHNESYLAAIANQGVTIYYNNLPKLATTATGIDVTGTATMDGLDLGTTTDAATVSNTASDYQLQLGAAQSTTGDIGRNISFATSGTTTAAINTVDAGTSNSQSLAFFTGNSTSIAERMRITSDGIDFRNVSGTSYVLMKNGDGIHFGASAGSNATSTVLDDYEEGTWTPTLVDASGNEATVNAGSTGGTYTKIGRMVALTGRCTTSSVSGLSGIIYIKNLPFAAASGQSGYATLAISESFNLNITGGHVVVASIGPSASQAAVRVWDNGGGNTAMTPSEWSDDGYVMFSGVYVTA